MLKTKQLELQRFLCICFLLICIREVLVSETIVGNIIFFNIELINVPVFFVNLNGVDGHPSNGINIFPDLLLYLVCTVIALVAIVKVKQLIQIPFDGQAESVYTDTSLEKYTKRDDIR